MRACKIRFWQGSAVAHMRAREQQEVEETRANAEHDAVSCVLLLSLYIIMVEYFCCKRVWSSSWRPVSVILEPILALRSRGELAPAAHVN